MVALFPLIVSVALFAVGQPSWLHFSHKALVAVILLNIFMVALFLKTGMVALFLLIALVALFLFQ
jgi:hypothetical protein